MPGEASDGRGDEDLRVLGDVALFVTRIEEVEEGERGVKDGRVVYVDRVGEVLHARLEQGFLELPYCRLAAILVPGQELVVLWSRDSSVGEEEVDVALFAANLVCYLCKRLLVGDVADYGLDRAVGSRGCGLLEGFLAPADDIDCFCAVSIECSCGVES